MARRRHGGEYVVWRHSVAVQAARVSHSSLDGTLQIYLAQKSHYSLYYDKRRPVREHSAEHDYFPLDEQHPNYAEDPYGLSKWVMEQQADAFARRYEWIRVASLRFHMLVDTRERAVQATLHLGGLEIRHLWGYSLLGEASRACLLAVTADIVGHQVLYIVAPHTASEEASLDLARRHYPNTAIHGDLSNRNGFFDCDKARRILGWRHSE